MSELLPPATKLRQGNVFTPVCHSLHRGGGGSLSGRPRTEPPRQRIPWTVTPRQSAPCTVKSGRYASYWNAFLFHLVLLKGKTRMSLTAAFTEKFIQSNMCRTE